jgi:membrane protease YdiL (CAAX protease family)
MSDTYDPQDLSGLPSRPPPRPMDAPSPDVLFATSGAEHPERRLTWRSGAAGLGIAFFATVLLATLIGAIFLVADGSDSNDNHAFQFVATFAGDIALVLTAYFVVAHYGVPTPASFGLRRFQPSAIGWVAVAFVSYLVLAAIYTVIVNPPPEDLPDQLGADESTLLAVVTGVFVIAVAPFAEEFFFRGFLYQALRNSWGTVLGVISSGAIFSAIHGAPDKFVPLWFLGMALAMLFEKTRSLWPCIMLHAINNVIAFAVSL